MTRFSIKAKIFFSHFLLITALISALSYKHYQNELNFYLKSVVDFHTASSHSLVTTSSLAISGDNYANLQMPEFVNELERHSKLLFMKVEGVSDYSSIPYRAMYDKEAKTLWRLYYPPSYESDTLSILKNLQLRQNDPSMDRVKIDFLIERSKDSIAEYHRNFKLTKKYESKIEKYTSLPTPHIDLEQHLLVLSLPTNNQGGGRVYLGFDISEINIIRHDILTTVWIESAIAFLLSLIVLGILSIRITRPINELSEYMSKEFATLDPVQVPSQKRSDEIGSLSMSFKTLLTQMQAYTYRLEQLSKHDPLTGLYNRRAFEEIFASILKTSSTQGIGLLYIDIDHFKHYNDHYGHNAGDTALQKVAETIEHSLHRKGDHAFRLGGEEFAIILSIDSLTEIGVIAERIRLNIQKLSIEHSGNFPERVVTVSIGGCFREYDINIPIDLSSMLHCADEKLYHAKSAGRNQIQIL